MPCDFIWLSLFDLLLFQLVSPVLLLKPLLLFFLLLEQSLHLEDFRFAWQLVLNFTGLLCQHLFLLFLLFKFTLFNLLLFLLANDWPPLFDLVLALKLRAHLCELLSGHQISTASGIDWSTKSRSLLLNWWSSRYLTGSPSLLAHQGR